MQKTIETHLPHLSQPQLTGLVLWVCGAILAGSPPQTDQNAAASALSPWGRWNGRRQYLREWLYDGSDRARPCQTELDVTPCFAPLLRWVLSWWRSGRLALAPAVPKDMTVIVLCDRGITSPELWQQICAQGWHPCMRCMRYPKSITFCADDAKRLPARAFVSVPDIAWIGRGTAFGPRTAQRRCTLLVVWHSEREEPWIILTDLAPDQVGPSWRALCFCIELGFKAIKSLGWKWDKIRRTDPTRVSRHWLVLSVTTLLTLA